MFIDNFQTIRSKNQFITAIFVNLSLSRSKQRLGGNRSSVHQTFGSTQL